MHPLTSVFKQTGIALKKSLGQNFLVDEAVLDRMASLAEPEGEVLEIGCGPGELTRRLALRAKRVWAIELDRAWLEYARGRSGSGNIEWIEADGADFGGHVRPEGAVVCVSNLPYSTYRRILLALFDSTFEWKRLCLTVQDDVYRKIVAAPGTREYGPLAVLCQLQYKVEKLMDVPRSAFYPAPRVDSVFARWLPVRRLRNHSALDAGLKRIFSQRRRTARAMGLDSDQRIERLSPDVLLKLL